MPRRSQRVAVLTAVALLLASAAPARAGGQGAQEPAFAPGLSCEVWYARYRALVEAHRAERLSEGALGRALDLTYGAYAKCVMSGPCGEEDLLLAQAEIERVLAGPMLALSAIAPPVR